MSVEPEEFRKIPLLTADIADSISTDLDKIEFNRMCEGALIDELEDRVSDDSPPQLYLLGRSGAGKSSLINALADGNPAATGDIEPETTQSHVYEIFVPGQDTPVEIIDSRGLFETTPADDGEDTDTVHLLKSDLLEYNPDLLIHLITPDQLRAGVDDFDTVDELDEMAIDGLPPRMICLNKVDTYLGPTATHWPPTGDGPVSDRILEALRLMPDVCSTRITKPYYPEEPHRGFLFDSTSVIGGVPLFLREEPYWNLQTLTDLLRLYLSEEGLMRGVRSAQRERRLRRLAREQTEMIVQAVHNDDAFDGEATAGITGLQIFLVAVIGALSGEELSIETADAYFDEVSVLGGSHSTYENRLLKSIDGIAGRLSGSTDYAGSYTRAIGFSAEAYFFEDRTVTPRTARDEMDGSLKDSR